MTLLLVPGLLANVMLGCSSRKDTKIANFPEDIPLIEGLDEVTVEHSFGMIVLNAVTKDEISHVVQFYRDCLPEKGWEEATPVKEDNSTNDEDESTNKEVAALIFNQGEAQFTILVSKDYFGNTRVSLQVMGFSK